MERQKYDILDLTKFILAFFILAIHTQLWTSILDPWLQVAVPLFFVISSYLFFSKISQVPEDEQKGALVKFLKRNLTFYAVWFVLLFPITLYVRRTWFDDGIVWGVLTMLKNVVFGTTFLCSWFIMANILAIFIMFVLRKANIWLLLIITALINILCCFLDGYKELIPFFGTLRETLTVFIGGPTHNFVVALFWTCLGKAFAEKRFNLGKTPAFVGLLLSAAALYAEWKLTYIFGGLAINRNCLFMLIPMCLFLFAVILNFSTVKVKNASFLRKSSTLIYMTHYPVILTVKFLKINTVWIQSLVTAIIVLIICFIVIKLSERKKFGFLKKLY